MVRNNASRARKLTVASNSELELSSTTLTVASLVDNSLNLDVLAFAIVVLIL